MRFTSAVLAALSVAASRAVIITNADFTGITAGEPFTVTYSEAVGPVTLYIGTGTSANLIQGDAIGSGAGASGSIVWTPASGGNFAFKIVDAGAPEGPTNPNYSGFFEVTGSEIETTTTGASSTTGMASTSTMMTSMMTTGAPRNATTTTMMTSTSMARGNGTSTTGTGSSTRTQTSSDSTGVPTQVPDSSAAGFASPLAFAVLAMGALLTLN